MLVNGEGFRQPILDYDSYLITLVNLNRGSWAGSINWLVGLPQRGAPLECVS
jgi:hypothetical protein